MATININLGFVAAAGGTVDVITATFAPAPASLYDGLLLWFVATGVNTSTTPTFNANGLGAKTIVKNGGAALLAGDIPGSLSVVNVEFNLANDRWEIVGFINGGITIGDTVSGGTANEVLYTDAAGNIFSDSDFTRDGDRFLVAGDMVVGVESEISVSDLIFGSLVKGISFSHGSYLTPAAGALIFLGDATGVGLSANTVEIAADNSANAGDTSIVLTGDACIIEHKFIDGSGDTSKISVEETSARIQRNVGATISKAELLGTSFEIELLDVAIGRFDNNAIAGNTRFLIYDVDNATLERVSVGVADSGGAGFKVLRIPN